MFSIDYWKVKVQNIVIIIINHYIPIVSID